MKLIKTAFRSLLDKAGYSIKAKKLAQQQDPDTMESALARLSRIGIHPATIIDVGAAQGFWTKKALEIWPTAAFELVEPLSEQREHLDILRAGNTNINYHLAVAGESKGFIDMNVSSDLDGSGIYGEGNGTMRQVPVTSIDLIAETLKKPLLIKLDTHGYEASILKGAAKSLLYTDALIIEVYGFKISPTCLTFHELTAHLKDLGFRLFDIVEVMRRAKDAAFWQADAIYLRNDHPVFLSNDFA